VTLIRSWSFADYDECAANYGYDAGNIPIFYHPYILPLERFLLLLLDFQELVSTKKEVSLIHVIDGTSRAARSR